MVLSPAQGAACDIRWYARAQALSACCAGFVCKHKQIELRRSRARLHLVAHAEVARAAQLLHLRAEDVFGDGGHCDERVWPRAHVRRRDAALMPGLQDQPRQVLLYTTPSMSQPALQRRADSESETHAVSHRRAPTASTRHADSE